MHFYISILTGYSATAYTVPGVQGKAIAEAHPGVAIDGSFCFQKQICLAWNWFCRFCIGGFILFFFLRCLPIEANLDRNLICLYTYIYICIKLYRFYWMFLRSCSGVLSFLISFGKSRLRSVNARPPRQALNDSHNGPVNDKSNW